MNTNNLNIEFLKQIEKAHFKLQRAIELKRKESTCLNLWSKFIKTRDGNQCILCQTKNDLSAHHICRKSFLSEAKLLTGNGITLCKKCHKKVHANFNGKPNLNLPMDYEGGEKIEIITDLFGVLLEDAIKRNLLCNNYYGLTTSILSKFKMFQGFEPYTNFPGHDLEQAYLIWLQTPLSMKNAILEANGFPTVSNPTLAGITVNFIKD